MWPDRGHGEAEQRANAALIVRAVNSHDALVEALRGLYEAALDTIATGVPAAHLDSAAEGARIVLEITQ